MKYAKRTDSNHKDIRTEVRARGYKTFDTSRYGEGFPDLVIALKNGRAVLLFEVKPEEGGEVTKDECTFMMQIVEPLYRMVTTAEQVDAVLKTVEGNY